MRLIAWVLRCLGCLVLAAGTVLAVGDAARSLAADRVRLMTISEAAEVAGVGSPVAEAEAGTPALSGVFASDGRGSDLFAVLGRQPASIVLGAAGLALLAIGRPNGTRRRDDEPGRRKV